MRGKRAENFFMKAIPELAEAAQGSCGGTSGDEHGSVPILYWSW
jgi:hypothetical protein